LFTQRRVFLLRRQNQRLSFKRLHRERLDRRGLNHSGRVGRNFTALLSRAILLKHLPLTVAGDNSDIGRDSTALLRIRRSREISRHALRPRIRVTLDFTFWKFWQS